MSSDFKNGIVILGAGNVATHLSIALKKAGYSIKCIYSKTKESAKDLALKVNTDFISDLSLVPKNADVYIIAVSDNAIESLLKQMNKVNGIILHTAGSIPLSIFEKSYKNYGVLYPVQTFSKSRNVDIKNIPICIEANSKQVELKLNKLASSLSSTVHSVNSEKRKLLHLSAVFACNFANHMYAASSDILNEVEVPFELLKPLILETAQKAIDTDPVQAQTGPAIRNDQNVIENHLEMLKDKPEFEKIYRFVSKSIFNLNKKRN